MTSLLKLIPVQYRLAAGLAALFLIAAASAGLGGWGAWKVATWRANKAWEGEVATLERAVTNLKTDVGDRDRSIETLRAGLATQNAAVERMAAESAEAQRLQREAQDAARAQARIAARRLADLQQMLAAGATPEDALKGYWEARAPTSQEPRP